MSDKIADLAAHRPGGPARPRRCPICGKPAQERTRPFCSERCRKIDLDRWRSEVLPRPDRRSAEPGRRRSVEGGRHMTAFLCAAVEEPGSPTYALIRAMAGS